MPSFIPPELVREIIWYIFNSSPPVHSEEPGVSVKPPWKWLEGFSRTSKTSRDLVLQAWFSRLFIQLPSDISYIHEHFFELSGWTRELHCVQTESQKVDVWNLAGFERLSSIRLDWLPLTMIPHAYSNEATEGLPFLHVPSSVVELDIRGLPWPSPACFTFVARNFPDLRILRMRQKRIWCGLCHTCSMASFLLPGPVVINYENGLGLPIHYATILSSLENLEAVYITIAYRASGNTVLDGENDDSNPDLWVGECDRCMEIMYEDKEFREKWVSRKKRLNEDEQIDIRPPALKKVVWKFWKVSDDDTDNLDEPDLSESEIL
ncbi:hypothetical protein BDQ12DRAFT_726667 [Crucibulum laeve]|uniref:F-box domain-containing protein n=1 Tax=Crucibulum laeve TaxID=68775 RepID=A0A5C3LP81_9AGAR|nr:hypothetical protein BDQ12DRAFT_726667 [Crucibulum laeve]